MDQHPDDTARHIKPHLHKEYEDPHFHDDDLELPDETNRKTPTAGPPKKPVRRIPPPPRRRFED